MHFEIIILILQIKKNRFREAEWFAQDHTAVLCLSWNSYLGLYLFSKHLLVTYHCCFSWQ